MPRGPKAPGAPGGADLGGEGGFLLAVIGSQWAELLAGRDGDEVQHEVSLVRGFEIADAPVTQGQWEAVMGNNPSHFKASGAEAVVESVSWHDAVKWCTVLAERHLGWDYRLPTEAEREYACRAGTRGPWNVATSKLEDFGWYDKNSGSKTHPVRQKRSNEWGLYDCHGNVWEWCEEWFGGYPKGAAADPVGPSYGEDRVLRGGGWFGGARYWRKWNVPSRSQGCPTRKRQ